MQEISAVSSLNTEGFPSSLILASSTGLFIGRVGEMKKLHIRTVSEMDACKGNLLTAAPRPLLVPITLEGSYMNHHFTCMVLHSPGLSQQELEVTNRLAVHSNSLTTTT